MRTARLSLTERQRAMVAYVDVEKVSTVIVGAGVCGLTDAGMRTCSG